MHTSLQLLENVIKLFFSFADQDNDGFLCFDFYIQQTQLQTSKVNTLIKLRIIEQMVLIAYYTKYYKFFLVANLTPSPHFNCAELALLFSCDEQLKK
jgi:hypothetical protein